MWVIVREIVTNCDHATQVRKLISDGMWLFLVCVSLGIFKNVPLLCEQCAKREIRPVSKVWPSLSHTIPLAQARDSHSMVFQHGGQLLRKTCGSGDDDNRDAFLWDCVGWDGIGMVGLGVRVCWEWSRGLERRVRVEEERQLQPPVTGGQTRGNRNFLMNHDTWVCL